MESQKYIITIFALSMLVFVGCNDGGDGGTTPSGGAFVGGDNGLIIAFENQAPPPKVYDLDSPFTISVKVENVGEYDINSESPERPTLTIGGVDYADFSTSAGAMTTTIADDIEGKKKINGKEIKGELITVDFPTDGNDLQYANQVAGKATLPFLAEICYPYKTNAQAVICVREDLLGTRGKEGVCDPNKELNIENSGSPVKIVNMEQSVQGSDRINLNFVVRHVGKGTVYKNDISPSCNDDTRSNKNQVWLEVEDPGLGEMSCSGLSDGTAVTGFVKLSSDDGSLQAEQHIRCNIKLDDPQDLEKVLKITLEFDYYDSVTQTVEVHHSD